jgi:uncharacterized membrane protein YphA (DoxX/SURF4 family)
MENNTKLSYTQLWVLVLLRIAVGWHFLYEGLVKIFVGNWTSHDYLVMSRWWFSGFFRWIADTPWALAIADFVNIYGLIAIGAGLLLGVCTRPALWSGLALLSMYYFAYPPFIGLDYGVVTEGHYAIVNKTLIEMLAMMLLLIFPTSHRIGLERLWSARRPKRSSPAALSAENSDQEAAPAELALDRRAWLKGMATLPFAGAFAYTVLRKKSYEEKHLLDAVTGASVKSFDMTSLKDLKGVLPKAEIKSRAFSRLILGGNLLSGWAHSRDLIYVSQLVRAYHHKDKIFATLLLAEKCGINTLLTNPIIAKTINEYWDRGIGKIQFISDCVGLNYSAEGKPSAAPYQEFIDRIQMAIDHGACACYIQGETADYYMEHGNADALAKAFDLMQRNNVIAGIGAHRIETIKACVQAGFNPDFWMKTLHHHNYWSAGHPQWHDNMYCFNPEETVSFMESLPQPFIAFKTLAAGAIEPKDGFRYAFVNGADIVCAGIYDFQMVQDVNVALDILNDRTAMQQRRRPWLA